MKWQTILALGLALVMGLSAVWVVLPLLRAEHAPREEMVSQVVAAVDISRGSVIEADHVRLQEVPKQWAPPNGLTKIEDATNRVASIPMLVGEPVLSTKVTPKGAGGGLAALIPKGMRAFTIQTPNIASGVAGFLLPGNKVDVLLTIREMGGRVESGGTITLLQNLEILAVDQRVDREATGKVGAIKELRSVTLLVTPEQAAKLDLGSNLGTLHLALRNPEDSTMGVGVGMATLKALSQSHPGLMEPEPTKVAPPPTPAPPTEPSTGAPGKKGPPPEVIRTIRGGVEGKVEVVRPKK